MLPNCSAAPITGLDRGRRVGAAPQRNFGLDLLRSVAILLVLANHAYLVFFFNLGHTLGHIDFVASILTFFSIEWLFVLSGFLIGAMIIRSFESDGTWWTRAKSFWFRRWFRTFPNYFLFLLVNMLLVALHVSGGQFTVGHAFFSQNLLHKEDLPLFFPEAFSLAIDEWFYFVLPLLVGIVGWRARLGLRTTFLLSTAVLIFIPTVARTLASPPTGATGPEVFFDWDMRFRRVTLMHIDATGWGVLGAATSRWFPNFWQTNAKRTAAGGLLLMASGMASIQHLYFGDALPDTAARLSNGLNLAFIAGGTFLALPAIASMRGRGGALGQVVDRLSAYSYSIYLVHLPLLYLLVFSIPEAERASVPHLALLTVFWFAITVALSALLYHSFEKPVSDLRERFTRRVDASPFQQTARETEVVTLTRQG